MTIPMIPGDEGHRDLAGDVLADSDDESAVGKVKDGRPLAKFALGQVCPCGFASVTGFCEH